MSWSPVKTPTIGTTGGVITCSCNCSCATCGCGGIFTPSFAIRAAVASSTASNTTASAADTKFEEP